MYAARYVLAIIGWSLLLFAHPTTAKEGDAPAHPRYGADYDPSPDYPYGRPHPEAPEELGQFAFFIGDFDCQDRIRQPDGSWNTFKAVWGARYFLNGHGIQDHYWAPSFYTSNIRLFDASVGQWKVTYFSMPTYGSGTWIGGMQGGDIVLEQDNGGVISRLTFYQIGEDGFEWKAQSIAPDQPAQDSWTSSCKRR